MKKLHCCRTCGKKFVHDGNFMNHAITLEHDLEPEVLDCQ